MNDIPIHFLGFGFGGRCLDALFGPALGQAMLARSIRRTLAALPDAVLHDMGLARSDIVATARVIAARCDDTMPAAKPRQRRTGSGFHLTISQQTAAARSIQTPQAILIRASQVIR